jgi:hypothetical protein|tara:strand:- start:2569 stop:2673 length:105 start_codon:yes stop_codon:yes gene_type:complete
MDDLQTVYPKRHIYRSELVVKLIDKKDGFSFAIS